MTSSFPIGKWQRDKKAVYCAYIISPNDVFGLGHDVKFDACLFELTETSAAHFLPVVVRLVGYTNGKAEKSNLAARRVELVLGIISEDSSRLISFPLRKSVGL